MSDEIIFNPDSSGGYDFRSGQRGGSQIGFITKLVMRLTGIQEESKANQALLVLALIFFIAAGIVLWSSF